MRAMPGRAQGPGGRHELNRAALGYGMFYRRPYRADGEIIGAEGTLFTVSENSLVACTMAARNRMIIHARIPCTNVKNYDGDLFAVEAPKEFDRVLRRFGDQHLALRFDDNRLEITLPRPGNARGIIWFPLQRVKGHMLSVTCPEPSTPVCLDGDLFLSAAKRVPRGRPLAWRPALMTRRTADLAIHSLFARRRSALSPEFAARFSAAVSTLETISSGRLSLPGLTPSNLAESTRRGEDKTFSADSLERF